MASTQKDEENEGIEAIARDPTYSRSAILSFPGLRSPVQQSDTARTETYRED